MILSVGQARNADHKLKKEGAVKIPVKVYEEVTSTMTVGDIMEHDRRGDIVREGDRIYLVTII